MPQRSMRPVPQARVRRRAASAPGTSTYASVDGTPRGVHRSASSKAPTATCGLSVLMLVAAADGRKGFLGRARRLEVVGFGTGALSSWLIVGDAEGSCVSISAVIREQKDGIPSVVPVVGLLAANASLRRPGRRRGPRRTKRSAARAQAVLCADIAPEISTYALSDGAPGGIQARRILACRAKMRLQKRAVRAGLGARTRSRRGCRQVRRRRRRARSCRRRPSTAPAPARRGYASRTSPAWSVDEARRPRRMIASTDRAAPGHARTRRH